MSVARGATTTPPPIGSSGSSGAAGSSGAGGSGGASGAARSSRPRGSSRSSGADRPSGPTAIVAPLAAELTGVLAASTERSVRRVGGWRRGPRWKLTLGRLAGEEVALMATGDGAAAAAAGLEALLAAVAPRRLLVLGVAGGLTPGLAEGTLVAARRVLAGDGSPVARDPDPAWLAAALASGAVGGVAIAADRIVSEPGARQALLGKALPPPEPASPLSRVGGHAAAARTAVATVDLESAAYGRVAARASLPYLVVRAVLDPAEETLPLDFEACRDAGGRLDNARVVLRALARPRSVAALWRLRARVRDAAARLGAFAEALLAAPAGGQGEPARAAAMDGGGSPASVVAGRRGA